MRTAARKESPPSADIILAFRNTRRINCRSLCFFDIACFDGFPFRLCRISLFLPRYAFETAKNSPAPDAGPDLGDRRRGRRVPDLRRRSHAGRHGVDSFDAGQVRCQSDLLRAGQERRDVSRPLQAHSRRRAQGGQPHLFAPEGMGHEPRTLYGGCRFCQRSDPQRTVSSALCAHHPGAGAFPGPALQTGDVGHHLARLQPPPVAPHLPEERHETPRAGRHRGVPRQRKGLPQHALRTSPYVGEDPADGPQMQGDRALRPFCGRLQRAVAPGIGISGFFS